MTEPRYATPEAFKHALETRLRTAAQTTGVSMGRLRQVLVFERFLARVFAVLGNKVVAKGGVVLELRLARARTTQDVDLGVSGDLDAMLEGLSRAGGIDLGDRLTFVIEADREHPTIDVEGMIYGGRRYRAEARMAGKLYGLPFGVDVAAGDALAVAPEVVQGTNFLAFAGIEPPSLRVYPREVHIAEKLHALTLPRSRPNSRVKDLPDLALLALTGSFHGATLRAAIERTFDFRRTHPVPARLPAPPAQWAGAYAKMANADDLPWPTLDGLLPAVRAFIDPVLASGSGAWDHQGWVWSDARGSDKAP
jgi:predicted nucleotidyltransferase component of viral defense system